MPQCAILFSQSFIWEGIVLKIIAANYFGWPEKTYDVFCEMGYEIDIVNPSEPPPAEDYEVGFFEASYITTFADKLKGIRFVQMQTAGHNHLPVDFLKANPHIKFCGGSGSYGKSISEWAICGALQVLRKTPVFEGYRRQNKWSWDGSYESRELWGSVCGILGTGDIGAECAKKLHAFNCRVIGLNTNGRMVEHFDECVPTSAIDELCEKCDVIINTLPLTASTKMLMGKTQLEKCKKTAVIVNVSRGGIIDEGTLAKMLNDDLLMGAAFDCYEIEPLPEESPLWDAKNFILNPHCCGVTMGLSVRYVEHYIQNAENYLHGRELVGVVTPGKGY